MGKLKESSQNKRVKVPTVLQTEAVECGAASLSMILAYYGVSVPLEELRILCNVSKDGSKANNILKASAKYGLEGKGYKKEAEDLRNMTMPVIIHWNFNHFLVLEGIKGDKVYLNDPAVGKRIVSYEEFKQSFTGIVLCFSPKEGFNKSDYARPLKRSVATISLKNKPNLFFLGLTGLLLITPGLIIPMISQFYVDTILSQKQTGWFPMLAVAFALVLVMKLFLSISENLLIIRLKTKLTAELSGTFIWKLINLSPAFFVQRYSGTSIVRNNGNIRTANTVSSKLVSTIVDLFMALLYLGLLLRLNYQLTIICIVITLLNIFIVLILTKRIRMERFRELGAKGKFIGVSVNGIQMIETLKSGGKEDAFFSKWAGYQTKYVNSYRKISSYRGILEILPHILSNITEVVILIICARNVMNGIMTFGMFIAYDQLMSGFLTPIVRTIGFASAFQELNVDIRRTGDLFKYRDVLPESEKEDTDQSDSENVTNEVSGKLQGALKIDNVSFGYSLLDEPFIKKISFEMYPGMRIALVGKSGSGKSTIAKLISGLNKPWSGNIYFDDVSYDKIPSDIRAASVSSIEQDISVFHGTIKNNINMWTSDIPEEDLINAAKDACIHEDIMKLPLGYNTIMEEGGSNFSGGQLQRLEIARALVTNPRILIMDEATSVLDIQTERTILDNIHRRGCSSIIISNRLSSIKDSDLILVIDDGKVIQSGTHEELSKHPYSLYSSLLKTE